jgi:Lrp/AsnC family leucine-responsive transcriptional regulator
MPTSQLDAIDRKILDALQQDGRISNVDLAERAGLSPSPCLRRVRLLEQGGVIEGYGARLNRTKVGLGLTAFVAVNIQTNGDDDTYGFIAAVRAMPEVASCHVTSGDHDFLLQVVVPDLEAYRVFTMERLIKIPSVRHIKSSFVIDTVKEAGALALPNHN